MPLSLCRLLYVSEATSAAESLLGVAEILGEAKRNNDQRDITGALAVGGGGFLQILEGSTYEIDRLLDRLTRDGRHSGLKILERRPIEERRFNGWAMKGPLSSPRMVDLIAAARDRRLDPTEALNALAE